MKLDFVSKRAPFRTGTGMMLAIFIIGLGALCSVPAVAAASRHHRRHHKHLRHRHHAKPVPSVLLTGLGATQQVWDSHHQADPAHPNNFDPMPEGTYPGALDNDQFYYVVFDELGRISAVSEKLTPGTTQAAANATIAASLLPPDAKKIAGPVQPAGGAPCVAEEFESRTLGAQDGGRTGITVTYQSYYDLYETAYTSQDVQEAFVSSAHGIVPAADFGQGGFGALICG